jgi:hypothetical protein
MAVVDVNTVVFVQGRQVLRFDLDQGVFVDAVDVPEPGQLDDPTKLAPPEAVDAQAIRAVAADPTGTRLALGSDYATSLQILDLADPSQPPVDVPLPTDTTVGELAWAADGTLVVTLLQYERRQESGNVLLVGPDAETHLAPPFDITILYAGDAIVTGHLGMSDMHLVSSDGRSNPCSCNYRPASHPVATASAQAAHWWPQG